MIQAAAAYWCSNTVRLQIEQDYLVAADGTVNRPFLAAIQSEVAYAESLGLVVVLNDQTQLTRAHDGREFMPTRRSFAFWDILTSQYWADPRVVLDLYNDTGDAKWHTVVHLVAVAQRRDPARGAVLRDAAAR